MNIVDLSWFIEFNADFCPLFNLTGLAEYPRIYWVGCSSKVTLTKVISEITSGDCESQSRLVSRPGGMMTLCLEIPGDAAMYSMIRVWSKPVQCPLQVSVEVYSGSDRDHVPGAALHGIREGGRHQAVHAPALSDGHLPQWRQRPPGQPPTFVMLLTWKFSDKIPGLSWYSGVRE